MSLSLLPSLRRHITAISWLLVAVVFLLDLLLPTTYAIRLLYIGVVLLGLWSSSRWLSLELAGVATVLSVGHVGMGFKSRSSLGATATRVRSTRVRSPAGCGFCVYCRHV